MAEQSQDAPTQQNLHLAAPSVGDEDAGREPSEGAESTKSSATEMTERAEEIKSSTDVQDGDSAAGAEKSQLESTTSPMQHVHDGPGVSAISGHDNIGSSSDLPNVQSSSTFPGSLTSNSEIFSPAASGNQSSASLQSSQASCYDDYGVDGSSPLLTISPSLPRSSPDASREPSTTQDSNSSTSSKDTTLARPETADVSPSEAFRPAETPSAFEAAQGPLRLEHESMPWFPSRARVEPNRPSTSPTHRSHHSPSLSTPVSAVHTPPAKTTDPFLSPSIRQRAEDDAELLPARTPVLQPQDYPPPKETHSLVKGYDPRGNRLINNYEVERKLGTGAHGTVKLARNIESGTKVAIKIVRRYPRKGRLGRHETAEDKVKREVAVLKKARHHNVVSLLEVIDDSDAEKVYLILEYVERGEISWRKPTEQDVARFELERVRREIAGQVDENFEDEALAKINEKLALHRSTSGDLQDQPERELESTIRPEDADRLELAFKHRYDDLDAPTQTTATTESLPLSVPSHDATELSSSVNTVRAPSRSSTRQSHASVDHPMAGGSIHGSMIGDDDNWTHASDIDHIPLFAEEDENSEWAPEEENYRYVPCLTMAATRDAFRDTVLGLEYLHYHGIIHRDIKPANLLWTASYQVKISDFGVSYLGRPVADEDTEEPAEDTEAVRAKEDVELAKTVGTPAFYAPELCDSDLFSAHRTTPRPQITEKIDVWALGVTLFAMVFGRLPFYDRNEFVMYEKIAHQPAFVSRQRLRPVDPNPDDESAANASEDLRADHVVEYEAVDDLLHDLLTRLLKKDPRERISLKEVKHHPWVLGGIEDKEAWVRDTDPTLKPETRPIEISSEEVQDALAPRQNFVDRVKGTLRRFTSVVRGRDPRKRSDSPKEGGAGLSASSSRSATGDREGRRQSLRSEDLVSAVRSSHYDHPLAQSTLASPVPEDGPAGFVAPVSSFKPHSTSVSPGTSTPPTVRPSVNVRMGSAAESVATVRGYYLPGASHFDYSASLVGTAEEHPPSSAHDSGGSSSSISKLLIGAGRRINQRLRSREPGRGSRDSSNLSSRASSADNLAGHDAPFLPAAFGAAPPGVHTDSGGPHTATAESMSSGHTPAMIGISQATVLGHLHSPIATMAPGPPVPLVPASPRLARRESAESLQRPPSSRGSGIALVSGEATIRRRAQTTAVTVPALATEKTMTPPPSQRASIAFPVGVSGPSDDQLTSGTSDASLAATSALSPPPVMRPATAHAPRPAPVPVMVGASSADSLMATGETITPAMLMLGEKIRGPAVEGDEAGYTADRDDDEAEGSEDEGIVMGGGDRKKG